MNVLAGKNNVILFISIMVGIIFALVTGFLGATIGEQLIICILVWHETYRDLKEKQ